MWEYTVYERMMEWWMFSFYLSTIKKNATEERENFDFLCFLFQTNSSTSATYFCHKFQYCFL